MSEEKKALILYVLQLEYYDGKYGPAKAPSNMLIACAEVSNYPHLASSP